MKKNNFSRVQQTKKNNNEQANKLGNLHKTPLQRLCSVGFNWLEWSVENSNNHLPIHPCAAVCSLQRTPYQSPLFFQERPRVFTKRCQWRLTDNGPCRASWHNGYRWHGFIVPELPDCTRQNATRPSRTSSQDSFAIRAVSDHDGGGRRDRTNEIHNYENVQLFVTRSQLVPVPACVCVCARVCEWLFEGREIWPEKYQGVTTPLGPILGKAWRSVATLSRPLCAGWLANVDRHAQRCGVFLVWFYLPARPSGSINLHTYVYVMSLSEFSMFEERRRRQGKQSHKPDQKLGWLSDASRHRSCSAGKVFFHFEMFKFIRQFQNNLFTVSFLHVQ